MQKGSVISIKTESEPSSQNSSHSSCSSSTSSTSRKTGTKRGRNGKKWVGLNWEHKERLKAQNNGILPQSEALTTSAFPHSDEWSEDNLPDILFFIKPPKSKYEGQEVGFLEENGALVTAGDNRKPIRDFPILPRRISLEAPGWLIETWRRLDPRITYPDILDRQIEDPELGLRKLDKNALQNHCRRQCRMVLGMWTSYERREDPHRTDVEAIERLSYQNIMLNTILDVCPHRQDRLTRVRLTQRSQDGCGKYYAEPFEVDQTNISSATFPIDHFILKSEIPPNGLHTMDYSMLAAWELSLVLQERARLHNLSHWGKLAACCRPVSWFDRTIKKRADNGTFDGGCGICTWVVGMDERLHQEWIDETRSNHSQKTSTRQLSCPPAKRKKVTKKNSRDDAATHSTAMIAGASVGYENYIQDFRGISSWSLSDGRDGPTEFDKNIPHWAVDLPQIQPETLSMRDMVLGCLAGVGDWSKIPYTVPGDMPDLRNSFHMECESINKDYIPTSLHIGSGTSNLPTNQPLLIEESIDGDDKSAFPLVEDHQQRYLYYSEMSPTVDEKPIGLY